MEFEDKTLFNLISLLVIIIQIFLGIIQKN